MKRELAWVTGASSGIGREMALVLASRKVDLVVMARRTERLEQLKKEIEVAHEARVHVMPVDLSDPVLAEASYRQLIAKRLRPDMLVNNAGMGMHGAFVRTDLEAELRMMQVNMGSLVTLTKLVLPDMLVAGHGRILNLASLLSFFPFPNMAVYAATKAFVLSFTEALRAEVQGTGVTVTALCPGTVDTEFTTPELAATNAYTANRPMDVRRVAERGVKALMKGEGTVVVGALNKLLSEAPRTAPRNLMLRIAKHLGSSA